MATSNLCVRTSNGKIVCGRPVRATARRNPAPQYMEVKNLPPSLKAALREAGYGSLDIRVEAATTYSVHGASGTGKRAFAIAVDLASGQTKTLRGSWGGSNMFTQQQVDVDNTSYPLPYNGAVVVGTEGGGKPTYAVVYVNPANLQALLPSGAEMDLSDREMKALQTMAHIKSSYRADTFDREGLGKYGPQNSLLQSLIVKGLVKATATGIQITTAGKSKAASVRGW